MLLADTSAGWTALLCSVALSACLASAEAADLPPYQLFQTGKYAECIEAAAKGIEETPSAESFPLWKVRAEMQVGRYAEARATLDAAMKQFPESIHLRWEGRDVCRFNGQAERVAQLDQEIASLVDKSAWRYSDAQHQVTLARWMLARGADPKKVLTGVLNEAKRRSPSLIDVHLAIGDLALDKHDYLMAGDAFQQAAKLDATSADAWLGVAKAFAPSDDEKATAALAKALENNPQLIEAHLLQADNLIDQEKYEEAEKVLANMAAINPHHPAALAYRAVLAHLRNQGEQEAQLRALALRHWATNPAVDYLIGKKLSQKYRFAEGEKYQRRALELDPKYLPAKAQLAQDLLRLGREEAGLKLAEEVYAADGYNIFAHNLVTLQESLVKFRTLEADGLIVRMNSREADIYGARVLALLQQAKKELCAKYEVQLAGPVIVELFPRQQDFAIRTFGLPGGKGFLGVCFGSVITANSPASQGASPACWEAVLWHEFCHVVTLNKTNNKMPRWLSEGISVYEERQKDKAWGQSMNVRYREMILGDDLTPVSQLSAAFLNPKSPEHVQFAYFESSLVVEFLVEKHGLETLKRVLVDLGAGLPINESLARYAGSSAALDEEFAKHAREKAKAWAPEADFSAPELPRRASAQMLQTYLTEHPHNYAALRRLAQQLMAEKKWAEAKIPLGTMRQLCPNDATAQGGSFLLATVHRELKENQEEREVLNHLAELSADSVDVFDRLTKLTADAKEWELTRRIANRWLAVNPLAAEPHRRAAAAAEELGDHALAAESYRALLQMEPFDPAEAHYKLASALHRQGKLAEAKREALLALEETPRYAAAQKLLLAIVDAERPQKKQEAAP